MTKPSKAPQPQGAFADLAQVAEQWQKYGKDTVLFLQRLAREGERVAVLVAATRLETELELAIKLLLDPQTEPNPKDDELFNPDRPIGSFSAKINVAYRL